MDSTQLYLIEVTENKIHLYVSEHKTISSTSYWNQ